MAKIRIFQPIVPEFRVALFEGLGEKYGDNIEIVAAERIGSDVSYPLRKMRYDYAHPFKKLGPLLLQKGLSLQGLNKGDIVVICGDIHLIYSLWLALKAKCMGIKVVWWGHHVSAQAKVQRVAIRLWIARRLSDVFLCYTDAGIDFLKNHGFKRVFATGNTIDLDAVESATKAWTPDKLEAFKRDHGLFDKRVILFCGVLRWKVRVDVLLNAFKMLCSKFNNLHLVIIGNGEERDEWRTLARRLEIDEKMSWTGELRGQDKLAPWFMSAEMFVYPGRIGLSLIHAFSFGLPVILNDNRENHGPEYSSFKPGTNGISFHENDINDLADKMSLALNDANFMSYGESGKALVFRDFSMKRMVERYSEALEAADNL